jgi:hypothetical protein
VKEIEGRAEREKEGGGEREREKKKPGAFFINIFYSEEGPPVLNGVGVFEKKSMQVVR